MMNTLRNKQKTKNIRHRDNREGQAENHSLADIFSPGERWFFLSLIIVLLAFARIRLLDVPLERDEGEYAYLGQLLLHGVPPYSAAYSMKFPGTYLMYALTMSLFGQTIQGIHLGLLAVNCLTVLLIFFLCKKIANDFAAIIASGAYAVLSVSSPVFGFAAHATHFVVLPAVAGSLLLLNAVEKNKPGLYFLSGALFGLAFLMKQPGFFFIAFGLSYVIYHTVSSKPGRFSGETIRDGALFSAGALLPVLAAFVWLFIAGVFAKFWFWTVQYAAKYTTQMPLSLAFTVFKYRIASVTAGFPLLWIMASLGLLTVLFHRDLNNKRPLIVLFSIFSFLTICPGFYFREHYFITLLPAVSILIGVFFNHLNAKSIAIFKKPGLKFIGIGIFAAIVVAGVVNQKDYFMKDGPVAVSKKLFGDNPFAESPEIARFIEAKSSPSDRVLVFGSEPQIYFYSKRRSATGYIYMYELMENQSNSLSMQKEMASEVESSKPKFVVDVHVSKSWIVTPESEKYIFDWFGGFLRAGYTLVGVVDKNTPDATVYKWYDDIKNYTIPPPPFVLIYERI